MIPVQAWLFFCALLLAWCHAVGVPAHELRPVAWVLSVVCGVGFLVDSITFVLERRS